MISLTGARPKLVPNKCVAKKSTSKQCLQSYQLATQATEYIQELSNSEIYSSGSEDEIKKVEKEAAEPGESFFLTDIFLTDQ